MRAGITMKSWCRSCALILPLAAFSTIAIPAQAPVTPMQTESQKPDVLLPNGKRQKDEILKAEYQQNIKDAAHLTELAQQLQEDLEKNDRFVLSLATLKKTEEIETLAKKIRSRLRRN
jgi:Tfp pilus assembly protein PilO